MHSRDLAPIVLDYCVSFLKNRPMGTRFHPKKDIYMLDTKTIIRIIRHGGDLRAQVTQQESLFANRLMKQLAHMNIVESIVDNNIYECTETDEFNRFELKVRRMHKLDKLFKGRKPNLNVEIQNVRPNEINCPSD